PEFVTLHKTLLLPARITTDPPGADMYLKGYDEPDKNWIFMGRSPLDTRAPLGLYRWRITKPGYETFEAGREATLTGITFKLQPAGSLPPGMVRVGGGTVQL